jgi:hypothetical protein
MSNTLTLVVLVASGGSADPATGAMARATHDALGAQASVVVREAAANVPSDEEAIAAEKAAGADAVVVVRWRDAQHGHAALRVHVARTGRWVDRALGFEASDADAERGRTIGFAVASMLPEPTALQETAPPAAAPPAAVPETKAAPEARPTPRTPPPHGAPVATLSLMGVGAVGGDAEGFGGALAGEWIALPWLALRVSGAVRAGSIDAAHSNTLAAYGGAGVVWRPIVATLARRFGFELRADYLLLYQSATRFATNSGSAETQSGGFSAIDGVAGASWLLAESVEALAGVGTEEVFGTRYIKVGDTRVAELPPLRLVIEAGIRARF